MSEPDSAAAELFLLQQRVAIHVRATHILLILHAERFVFWREAHFGMQGSGNM